MRKKELNRIEQLEATILRMANYIEKPKFQFGIGKKFIVTIRHKRFIWRDYIYKYKIIEMYFSFENFEWIYICIDENQNTIKFTESQISEHDRF